MRNILRHRYLLFEFSQRDFKARFAGSTLGVLWALLQPLLMLCIYSYVFSVIFQVKWGGQEGFSNLDFAMTIFSGLIIFQIFSDPMYRCSNILTSNSNFVKKVVFPLEILPISVVLSNLFLNLFSIFIYFIALFILGYPIGLNMLWTPVILAPLVLLTTGLSFLVTTCGVFVKDLGHAMTIIMNILFYVSPVFYPVSAVPEQFRAYMALNPFTTIIESFRNVTFHNQQPDWTSFSIVSLISLLVFIAGYYVFKFTKESFSDVI